MKERKMMWDDFLVVWYKKEWMEWKVRTFSFIVQLNREKKCMFINGLILNSALVSYNEQNWVLFFEKIY